MFAAALALLTFAAAPVPKNLPQPPATPEGEWKLVEVIHGGMPADPEYIGAAVTIKDGNFSVASARRTEAFTFTFDAKAAPAKIDLVSGEKGIGSVVPAIYKLDADKLTICFVFGGGERPTKFESPANSKNALLVMERVKK
jgi:uncharacterized protein (TIGR03067 family)